MGSFVAAYIHLCLMVAYQCKKNASSIVLNQKPPNPNVDCDTQEHRLSIYLMDELLRNIDGTFLGSEQWRMCNTCNVIPVMPWIISPVCRNAEH